MQKFFILWGSLLVLLIGGCAQKHYEISKPKLIVLKTPKIKFADTGYIRSSGESVEAELFTAGVAVEKISIDDKVCISSGCMSEEAFVRDYLSPEYPKDILRRILLGEQIYSGQNTSEQCSGIRTQYIRNDKTDIVYRLRPDETYFKDRMNGLIIKISDIEDNNATQ
ncbi:hypothetical protein [Sulfuricurvum sp.]|uniref:hypothetical protein n=1 Tax=Sulfuricurvum sp. TaxID=2025608 RepID=UPI00262E64E2|nr:hypothetical protein [Sulfuricurvum sp.]MDD2265594.1 hypothetical protein [Sulfuricurvum sp.]MDD2785157.1 hypothetical protein [Sulfuricurvum sp.]